MPRKLAGSSASIERRLRRALADHHVSYASCYRPLLAPVLDWATLLREDRQVVLAGADSSHIARIHLLRVSLPYWGGSLPLAWARWPQHVAQAPGQYWDQLDTLFAQVAARLPAGLEVVVTADRACAVPNRIARVAAQGWH